MNKIKFTLIVLFLFSGVFIACEKSDSTSKDDPGNIPGMGEAGGELEILEPFVMPEGISIVGEISGFGDAVEAIEGGMSLLQNSEIRNSKSGYFSRGSGGQWVILNILLQNNTDFEKEFTFNKGCVFECQEQDYQHAICLGKVRFKIAKRIQKRVKLFLYCINKGRSGSKAGIAYRLRGVTKSERMMKLCNALQYKKIDVSHFNDEQFEEYENNCIRIQNIVWAITNGKGASSGDWDFINKLHDLLI